jgi:hypothetical protein
MTSKTQETMSIASKCACGKHLYYCGNDCPFANPFDMNPAAAPSPKQPEAQPQQEGEKQAIIEHMAETQRQSDKLIQGQLRQLSTLTAENAKLKEQVKKLDEENETMSDYLDKLEARKDQENAKLWKALEEEVKRPFLDQYKGDDQQIINGYLNMADNAWQQFKSNLLK